MKAERLKKSEEFLDTYLGGNRNISTLTWEHWVECLQDYADKNARIQIEKDREDLIKENKLTTNGMIANKIRNRPITLDK
jgi:hypothetical protein